MWRSTSSVSSRSSLPPDIVNSEQLSFESDNSFNFDKWNIPKLSNKEIYTTSWLKSAWKSEYLVKTVEQTFAISGNNSTFQLFNKRFVNDSKNKEYKFLHVGSVQVVVKPLTRLGINASVLLCLRDARFINFRTSILGMIQSSLFNGPVHFDVFPNLTLSLDDINILKALTLNVLTSGYDMEEGSRPLAIIYRIYYKLMKTNLDPQAVIKSVSQSTLLIQSSTHDANIQIPKMIQWDDINLPNEWLLENVSKPPRVVNDSSSLDYIQQYLDGSVKINFSDLNNQRRNSFAGSSTTEGLHKRDKEIEDLIFPPPSHSNFKLQGISTNSQVSSAFYSTKTRPPNHKEDEDDSPSASDFDGSLPPPHQCNAIHAISKDFFSLIDWPALQKDYSSKKNKDLRHAYLARFSEKERDFIKVQWARKMIKSQKHILFFDFLQKYFPFDNALNVVKKNFVKEDKTVVKSSHPPLTNILIDYNKDSVKGSPFKSTTDVSPENRMIIEQNNFINQSLHTIGQQLDRIEEKLISPSSSKIENPLISIPKKKKSLDSKIDQNQTSTSEFHQKKTSEFSNTDSISSDFSSFDKLNHMNCSVLTKSEKQEDFLMTLISKIENPELKEKYLKKLKKNKISKSKISLDETLEEFSKQKSKVATVSDLQHEISNIKKDIVDLKKELHDLKSNNKDLEQEIFKLKDCFQNQDSDNKSDHSYKEESNNILNSNDDKIISLINKVILPKWYAKVHIVVAQDYAFDVIALIDSGADLNCIQEGLIPSKYFEKSTEKLNSASGSKLQIKYELNNVHVCQNNVCFHIPSVLVKNMTDNVILGIPFICMLYPFTVEDDGVSTVKMGVPIKFHFVSRFDINQLNSNLIYAKTKHLNFLKQEVKYKKIAEQLYDKLLQSKISAFNSKIIDTVCSELPNAFWHRKKHIVSLPYVKDFSEKKIPTKARPIQMNAEILDFCQKEIADLLAKGIIRKSKSPWSCAAFYVRKNVEIERGVPRLVINYKPLNDVLEWIRYPIPNRKDLVSRLSDALVFSKFDMKSGFWQVQIDDHDRYKTAFTTPFGHYEWNVMPFGLKNAPSEFQNIMNDIFNPFTHFTIVYIDDVLIFSKSIEEHWKHLNSFLETIKHSGLVVSAKKIKLFQTKIRFLGFDISEGQIRPIDRAIQFADKFPDVIIDKTQLQRFLGSLNYIADFYKDLRKYCKPLFDRLQNNPPPWTDIHTSIVRQIKIHVKTLPCLGIPSDNAFKIVETDASEIGFGGILKQLVSPGSPEQIVRFHSGSWNSAQSNYSTIKKEILSVVLCFTKFQSDLLNQRFLLRIDCKSAKYILKKDVENIASKQIFARWQAILSAFDFDIEYTKGSENSIPDFLTREFLQCHHGKQKRQGED
jgi:cell division protein FtsB